jgi:hypothetical protein
MNHFRNHTPRSDSVETLQALCARLLLSLIVGSYIYCSFPDEPLAETRSLGWETQLYGGRYYDDQRIGAYGIGSIPLPKDLSIIGEVLHERYRGDNGDYIYSGVGGHLLWEAGESTKVGLTGSYSTDEYDYDKSYQDPKSEYASHTVALEGEFSLDALTLAAQFGNLSSNYYGDDTRYLSSDVYYWGEGYRWYARGAIRASNYYKEYTLEGYQTFLVNEIPLNVYVGATRNDLSTKEEILTSHTRYDSFYTGCYIDLLTTASSNWNLWFDVTKQDPHTVFTLELTITIGSGVDGAPYISAFGFTP